MPWPTNAGRHIAGLKLWRKTQLRAGATITRSVRAIVGGVPLKDAIASEHSGPGLVFARYRTHNDASVPELTSQEGARISATTYAVSDPWKATESGRGKALPCVQILGRNDTCARRPRRASAPGRNDDIMEQRCPYLDDSGLTHGSLCWCRPTAACKSIGPL